MASIHGNLQLSMQHSSLFLGLEQAASLRSSLVAKVLYDMGDRPRLSHLENGQLSDRYRIGTDTGCIV